MNQPDVLVGNPFVRILDEEYGVDVFYRFLRRVHHAAGELVTLFIKPRGIRKHDLKVIPREYPQNAVARRLRFRRNDCHLLPHKRVHKRALSRVCPADHGNVSAFHDSSLVRCSFCMTSSSRARISFLSFSSS